MSNTLKALLALALVIGMTILACSCETVKANWPHTKTVMVAEGKEAIEDIVNNPTPGNAVAEGLEWLYLVLAALLGGAGKTSYDKLVNGTRRKESSNGD